MNQFEIRLIQFAGQEYQDALRLRYQVLRQPLGLQYSPQDLTAEATDYHFAAFDHQQLVGCLLLRPITKDKIKMRQVAVSDSSRGRGVGRKLVQHAELFALKNGYSFIELHARENAVPFYLALGYQTAGDPFVEVTIPHWLMHKAI
jgi:predicted GNAT family N-acyltransferase